METKSTSLSSTSASRIEIETTRPSGTSASRMETKSTDQYSINASSDIISRCNLGHSMHILSGKNRSCDRCRQGSLTRLWRCKACEYDICFDCHPKSTATSYGSTFARSTSLPKIFTESVEQMKAGIIRNAFNHFKEGVAGWKECLHENLRDWEPGWDATTGWSNRKECTCNDCKKVLSRERWESERIHFNAVLADDSNRNSLIRDTGIRVDVLVAFAIDHDCWEWPTWRVVRDIIRPATRNRTRCRYGDLPGMKENNYFGPATIFMSHTWSAPFGNLVAAAAQGARYNRYVWIDIFAVRQWPGNVADLNFRSVIDASTAMIVSVSPVKGLHRHRYMSESASTLCCTRIVLPGSLLIFVGAGFVFFVVSMFDGSISFDVVFGMIVMFVVFVWLVWILFRKGGDCSSDSRSQKYFFETDEGKEAKKNIFFFRLWCVVEVASAVENKIPIIIKGGQAEQNDEGIYEYDRKSLGKMFSNMEEMVDIASSDCAVPADKVREMKTIHEKFGANCNSIINNMVSSVITGARIAEDNNIIEVDSACCGEVETLENLSFHESKKDDLDTVSYLFDIVDADGSGFIEPENFRSMLNDIGHEILDPSRVKYTMQQIDILSAAVRLNSSTRISRSEFISAMAGLGPTENKITLAKQVLLAACAGGRWRVVNLLHLRW